MSKTWAEISCEAPAALGDDLADFLPELSGGGVCVDNRALDTFSLDDVAPPDTVLVKAYFPGDQPLDATLARVNGFLETLAASSPGFRPAPPKVALISEEDWGNSWKEHFKPTRIGRRLIIKPTWEKVVQGEEDIILELDPGMAFGTGTHPTTRLCLEKIEQLFSGEKKPGSVLDVGTGSGILAIGAVKLGATEVVAIDIDPEAVAVAADNFRLNGVSASRIDTTPLGQIVGVFGLVVANILAEELVKLRGLLCDRLGPAGHLVLSGILVEKEHLVLVGFADRDLVLEGVSREGDWSCITYRRRG